jgi:hypothetical protein
LLDLRAVEVKMTGDNDVARRATLSEPYFTPAEIETLGMLVNGLGIVGSQLILRHRPDLYLHAHANLRKRRSEHEDLLKRLDHFARQSKDESAVRLIEDLDIMPADAVQSLQAARRCLLAAAFLGHCIAAHSHPATAAVAPHEHKRLN